MLGARRIPREIGAGAADSVVTRLEHIRGPSKSEPSASFGFDAVYRQYGRTVARWIARLGGPEIVVEDVVQEVFLAVSRQLPAFRRDAKVTTWLFAITRNIVGNWRRRERWRRRVSRLTARIADTTRATQPTPIENLERRQAGDRFYRILDAMPERHRTVLVLFEIEAQSAAEIGDLLNLKTATVRVQLHRARADFLRRMDALEAVEGAPDEE
jgi:RNA polymerase sigma-70 factor (ECF subfamily)